MSDHGSKHALDGTNEGHGPDGAHDHGHGAESTSSRKLAAVAAINLLGFLAELAGGLLFGSVALIGDAFHMLFDALAYVLAFAAAFVASSSGDGDRFSYGLHRLEPFAAFLNGALLLPMVGYILWESYQRFLHPIDVGTVPTLVVAIGGLLVNVVSVVVLQGDEMSLNEKGAFYHLLGDAGGSVAVIVATVVVEVTGIRVVDPIAAGLIALIVTWSAVGVLRDSGAIFLHRSPLDVDALRTAIADVDGVDGVGDLHAWQVCSQITVATTHVETDEALIEGEGSEVPDDTPTDRESVIRRVHEVLAEYGVDHATVEICPGEGCTRHLDAHGH